MLMYDYLQEKVDKYCELNNIPYKNGQISGRYRGEVQVFIQTLLKQNRSITRNKEKNDECKIEVILRKSLGSFCESPIEEYMFNAFENAGIDKHCVPQYQIGTKRVDFAFPEAMLIVECDGKEYHFTDQLQIENDQKRDKYLAKKGWRIMHFDGLAIRRNIGDCMNKITSYLEKFNIR